MRLKVIMLAHSQYPNEYKKGDEGEIDGYVRGGNNTPCAVVVIGHQLFLAPINHIEVIKIPEPLNNAKEK